LRWIGDYARAYRPQLRFCLRMTVGGLLALAVALSFSFPLHGLWTVLTAVVVTQVSVGGSLRATVDYMVGTLGGAIYAAAIGVLIPHATAISQAGVLALAVAPLAFAAAVSPSFRVAPFSAVTVLLIGGDLGASAIEAGAVRVLEVALGGAVAIAVSVLVLPERAHTLGLEAAARILRRMADILPELMAGIARTLDMTEIGRLQGDLGRAVTAFQALADEAKHERMIPLARGPDPSPLSRTLLRLRHDLVILGRAAAVPAPEAFAQRLGPLIAKLGAETSEFLRGSAIALTERRDPPTLAPAEAALTTYESEVAALRNEGLTRPLSTGEAERLFALGFGLEQLRRDLADLAQRVQEFAQNDGRGNKI
jgi:uncharacterized membrane protein YccC